ncbi:MAG: sialidase family protein, partial [Actinomycetota bacterium]
EVVSPQFAGARNAQLVSFDPYTWVDPDTGRVYTIDLTVACSYLSFTDDGGDSWITNPLACGRPVNDHQTLFSGPPAITTTVAYDNVVYYCWNDVATSSCSRSLDGGISFAPTGSPAFPGYDPEGEGEDNFCGGLHAHGHVGRDGTVYLPRGYCGQPYLGISRDEGATWERVQVANNGISHHEAGVATDKKGNIYYTWVARNRLPYLAVSTNGGKKWTKPMMIGPPGIKEANLPGIAVGGVGKVAMAYMGSLNSPFRPGQEPEDECTAITSCGGDDRYKNTTWSGYVTISADALKKNPLFYTGSINHPKDPLKRQECGPGRCGTTVYDFIDVTIGPDGTAWTAMVDACTLTCATTTKADIGNMGIVGEMVGGPSLN